MANQIEIIKSYLKGKFANAIVDYSKSKKYGVPTFRVMVNQQKFFLYIEDETMSENTIIEILEKNKIVEEMQKHPFPETIWLKENALPEEGYSIAVKNHPSGGN